MTTPDGGQAFPVLECSMNNVTGEMLTFQSSPGLTVRDYFAAHTETPLESEFNIHQQEALAGRPYPKGCVTELELLKWEADWRAGWRFLCADAMLNAR